ncbi:MAG: MBL fold metallo-hydrolase [Dermatophilaceae bacterium]
MFREVADRVFVARYPQWDVNVGLILGRDGAAVIDTRAGQAQGREVLADITRLARDIRVTHVINTHVHFDHTFGNVAFEGTTIHAHANVGAALDGEAARVKAAFAADPGDGLEHGYTAADAADAVATRVRPPDCTFSTGATIDLGDRAVTMSHAGRGHTDGDIAVLIADADLMFLGDLVEESGHPSLGEDCWPLEWSETLASHLAWIGAGTTVVPGHGHPVDERFVTGQRDQLNALATVIRERRRAGMPLEQAQHEPDHRLPYPLAHLTAAFARGWDHVDLSEDPTQQPQT